MRRRVLLALQSSGLGTVGQLQQSLLRDTTVFARVLDDLTVRVSDMFRDPSFYRAFRDRVVPHLRTYPILRIWHCGCASGEEVYATAILLHEEGLFARAQLYATDLSQPALQQVKQGVYPVRRLAEFENNYRQSGGTADFATYYTQAYDQLTMVEWLRRNIFPFQHDLVSDQAFGEMQVIFCRNVLIYFNDELKRTVIGKLVQGLRPGGFLCLGKSERLAALDDGHHFVEFSPEERIYRYEATRR